ncbi:MAG: hypothetical protein CMJ65_00125 [Planctomycetaceae bacterium]|jgi:hypothetical protein|nr:hypothetical protein [Planctomycetaceae bacterium]
MTMHAQAQNPATASPQGLDELADTDYLSQLLFDRGASSDLRRSSAAADTTAFARAWVKQLSCRVAAPRCRLPERAYEWTSTRRSLLSAWKFLANSNRRRRAIGGRRSVRRPYSAVATLEPDATDGDLLAALGIVSMPVRTHQARAWFSAWRRLVELVSSRPLAGELAYTTGLLLAPLKGTSRLRRDGIAWLQKDLLDRTDTDGTPHADLLPVLPQWLGTLVRAASWGRRYGAPPWNRDGSARFDLLVELVASLYREGDRMVFSAIRTSGVRALLDAATRLTDLPTTDPARRFLADHRRASRKATAVDDLPVTQSDWAQVAMLRCDWSPVAPAVVVTHEGPRPRLDVSLAGRSLLSGDWSLEVTCEGRSWELSEWRCVCWVSDADADYLELQSTAPDGSRVDRQILLSRTEDLLILADAVLGTAEAPVHCRSGLSLSKGIKAHQRRGHRDWRLGGRTTAARVFPLAMPDSPLESGPATFSCVDQQLEWSHSSSGPTLYLPLVLDFSSSRRRRAVEWNSLTITEDRRVVSPAQAAGHRLKIGGLQLLLYRSLLPAAASRAVLGQHTPHETLIGEIEAGGDITPLVIVN